jgi:hypothetical protein
MASGKKNYFRHYLYIIGEELDVYCSSYSGSFKVGISSNPTKRMKDLQCANPRKLEFIFVAGFENRFICEVMECGMHSKMNTHKIRNEWFIYNKYTEKWINKLISSSLEDLKERFQ